MKATQLPVRPCWPIALLAVALAGGGCRSIAGYRAVSSDSRVAEGSLGDLPATEWAATDIQIGPPDGPRADGPCDTSADVRRNPDANGDVQSDADSQADIRSSPDTNADVQSNPDSQADVLSLPPDLTFFDDATGACHEPSVVRVTTPCGDQHVGCMAGDPTDPDCDGIETALDPNGTCNPLLFQDECATSWVSALSDGCTVLLASNVVHTVGNLPSIANTLTLVRFRPTGALAPGGSIELVLQVGGLGINSRVVGDLPGTARLYITVKQGATTDVSYKTIPSPPVADYVLGLRIDATGYHAALYDALHKPMILTNLTSAPSPSGPAVISMRVNGAPARVDYLRIYEFMP